jgi:hypothetical protein
MLASYRQPQPLITNPIRITDGTRRIWYALDILLVLIMIGPVLAPLFHNTNIWLFDRIAHWIIYPLGQFICPQDQHAVPIMGTVMAVCTRCYAGIGGLFVVRMALTGDPNGKGLPAWLARTWWGTPMMGRALFIITIFALWTVDVRAEQLGWWTWSQPMLIATGPIIGLAVGFLVYGLLAALTRVRPAWDR